MRMNRTNREIRDRERERERESGRERESEKERRAVGRQMVWIKTSTRILYSKVIVDQTELRRRLASPGRSGQADIRAQRCKITSVSRRCGGEARMHAHPNILKSVIEIQTMVMLRHTYASALLSPT